MGRGASSPEVGDGMIGEGLACGIGLSNVAGQAGYGVDAPCSAALFSRGGEAPGRGRGKAMPVRLLIYR